MCSGTLAKVLSLVQTEPCATELEHILVKWQFITILRHALQQKLFLMNFVLVGESSPRGAGESFCHAHGQSQ